MGVLASHTTRIRTYSSSELAALPALAEEQQLYITAGVWLDAREDNNQKEINALEQAVRTNSSIERVIVGNEQILHGAFTPAELILKIREVKRRARKPVSTAEPWHVWLRYPELAANVDFITVHLLPYWEGLPVNEALDYSFDRLRQIEEKFPNKKIVIGEVGWPSQGDRRMGSYASPAHQAQFIREFLVRAQARNLDYFLMEAIDQPWKIDNEGRAGPYWGIMDADREPKFNLQGPIEKDSAWRTKAALSSTIGMLALFWFMVKFYRMRLAQPHRLRRCLAGGGIAVHLAAGDSVRLLHAADGLDLRPDPRAVAGRDVRHPAGQRLRVRRDVLAGQPEAPLRLASRWQPAPLSRACRSTSPAATSRRKW